jgi:N-acetylneuraminic acid mutarotase
MFRSFSPSRPGHAVRSQSHPLMALAAVLLATCAPVLADGWTLHSTTGPEPSARSAPALGALGRDVYLFGGVFDGLSGENHVCYNDLYRFNTQSDRWTLLQPQGPVPPPRAFAASATHPGSGRLFVFGGGFNADPFYSDFSVYDDLWAYSARANQWTQIHAANAGPSGRSRPSSWMVGNRLYIFGGISAYFSTLNDLWVYNLDSNRWTEVIPDGAAGSPPPRHEAMSGSGAHGGRLILYGGETLGEFGFVTLGDTWEYNIARNRWENLTPAPAHNIDPVRNLAAAGILKGDLYVQGGDMPGGEECCGSPFPQNVSNDLWRFDRHCQTWQEISSEVGPGPSLKRHRSVEVGNELFVFSGYDFSNPEGQVYNLDVYSFKP